MADGEVSERVILQLRAVLRGISPLIWRRLLVPSDTSIAQLHDVLQVAFGWEDVHLHRFEIRGREYGLSREGGVLFDTDARKVRIGDLKLRRMERFTYEYDFGDSWVHDIRIEATLPIDPSKRYPMCVAGKCSAPPEDCGGPDAFMENRWQYEAMGSGESREELDGLIDDMDEEEWEIARRYHPAGFNRRAINQALAALVSNVPGGSPHEIHDPSARRRCRRSTADSADPYD
ncbi:MAG: plasmid pRiA4b ORF-3 family protein [Steroidobacteraceae bacterium]|jgi:pRiA4b ORF-3-like protein